MSQEPIEHTHMIDNLTTTIEASVEGSFGLIPLKTLEALAAFDKLSQGETK